MSFRFDDAKFPEGRFFVFPATVREYVFEVGGKEHVLRVPAEFDLDELIAKKFAGVENLQDLPLIITQDQGFPSNRLKLSDKQFNKGDFCLGLIFYWEMHSLLIVLAITLYIRNLEIRLYSEQDLLTISIER